MVIGACSLQERTRGVPDNGEGEEGKGAVTFPREFSQGKVHPPHVFLTSRLANCGWEGAKTAVVGGCMFLLPGTSVDRERTVRGVSRCAIKST